MLSSGRAHGVVTCPLPRLRVVGRAETRSVLPSQMELYLINFLHAHLYRAHSLIESPPQPRSQTQPPLPTPPPTSTESPALACPASSTSKQQQQQDAPPSQAGAATSQPMMMMIPGGYPGMVSIPGYAWGWMPAPEVGGQQSTQALAQGQHRPYWGCTGLRYARPLCHKASGNGNATLVPCTIHRFCFAVSLPPAPTSLPSGPVVSAAAQPSLPPPAPPPPPAAPPSAPPTAGPASLPPPMPAPSPKPRPLLLRSDPTLCIVHTLLRPQSPLRPPPFHSPLLSSPPSSPLVCERMGSRACLFWAEISGRRAEHLHYCRRAGAGPCDRAGALCAHLGLALLGDQAAVFARGQWKGWQGAGLTGLRVSRFVPLSLLADLSSAAAMGFVRRVAEASETHGVKSELLPQGASLDLPRRAAPRRAETVECIRGPPLLLKFWRSVLARSHARALFSSHLFGEPPTRVVKVKAGTCVTCCSSFA